jgi:hypothetical protein
MIGGVVVCDELPNEIFSISSARTGTCHSMTLSSIGLDHERPDMAVGISRHHRYDMTCVRSSSLPDTRIYVNSTSDLMWDRIASYISGMA